MTKIKDFRKVYDVKKAAKVPAKEEKPNAKEAAPKAAPKRKASKSKG